MTTKVRDHTRDLPPVAELQDVTGIATMFGADRGFAECIGTEVLDQIVGVGERLTTVDKGDVHEPL